MHSPPSRSVRSCVLAAALALTTPPASPAATAAADQASCGGARFIASTVTSEEGIELFARAGGDGGPAVIVPADFLLYETLCPLAASHRMVFYDMRNRGRSAPVADGSRLTLEADVRDLEAVRRHFGIESAALVGYSYLGKMVVLYALEHPRRVARIVQLGAVPMDRVRIFPPELTASWDPPAEAVAALRAMRAEGLHERDPEAYCEAEWEVLRPNLVGDPANASRLASRCALPSEHPTRLAFHMRHHFLGSAMHAVVTPAQAARVAAPVLTVHGTLDRNAPYGGGREWAAALPGARLLTVEGAAHAVAVERDLLPELASFFAGDWPAASEDLAPATEGQLSQLQAFDLVRAARDRHRPGPAPAGSHLSLTLDGTVSPRSQGPRPEPPLAPFPVRQQVTFDTEARRLELIEELTWPDFNTRFRTVALGDGGFEVDLVGERQVPPFLPPSEVRARVVRRLPPLLLDEILAAPGSLRSLGVERRDGRWLTVVGATHEGERLDLYLAESGELAAVGRLVDEPMLGDAYEDVRFSGETRAGDWRLPARIVRELAGVETSEVVVESASWAPADAVAFAPPPPADPGAAELPPAALAGGGPPSDEPLLELLAPRVWRAQLPGSPDYASLVVERGDHLVLVEAPVGAEPIGALLATLGERFPGKPVRWVVATHHHFDHSGGVPAALAAGATLVTTPGNVGFFRRAVAGPGTLSGRVERADEPAIETVGERLALAGGPPEVIALRVPANAHAEEMLAVWLPASGILFQGDLVRFPLAASEPRPHAAALLELVDEMAIAAPRIVGVHGEEGTVEALRAALGERFR